MTWISPWHSTGVSARQSRAASRQENADSAVSRFVDRGESPHRSDVRPRRRSGRAVSGEFRSAYLAAGVAMARLTEQLTIDPATGLPNATEFNRKLSRALAAGRRRKRKLAVLVLELEGLSAIGEDTGDSNEELRQLACRLQEQLRPADSVART